MPGGRPVHRRDICSMSDGYLDAALALAETSGLPLYLAHDRQQPERAASLVARYHAVTYKAPDPTGWRKKKGAREDGRFVDMLMLIRSQFFVGNSQSSFSQNVARVRKAVYKDADRLQRGGRNGLGEPRHVQSFLDLNGGNLRKDGHGIVEAGD